MHSNDSKTGRTGAVSDHVLGSIAEHGFFATAGSLAAARQACDELIFARAMITAQTATIDALNARLTLASRGRTEPA